MEGKGILVSLDTELSPELIVEGLARELVRKIQELRKNSGLAVTDRIGLYFHNPASTSTIAAVLKSFANYIETETLSKIKLAKAVHTDADTQLRVGKETIEVFLWKEKKQAVK